MADAAVASSSSSSSKRKQRVVCISSEDDENDEESDGDDEEEETSASEEEFESEDETDEEDPAASESESSSLDDSDDDDDDYGEYDNDDDDDDYGEYDNDDDEDNNSKIKPTDEEHCNKIIDLLRGRKCLNSLKLEECKAYLRKHELRISGNKETCIKRILEHWRIKDGNGEKLYPKSSFVVNCTGDVCRGDVVMFKQKVYEKFDIVKRGGGAKILGRRIIAGRVVNESYGGLKQQHTFSIEVLWSKGVKPLRPLSPLFVKGRNLYRLKTFRQPWSNEAERSRVLSEKHDRGAAARQIREIARTTAGNKGFKRNKKSSRTEAPHSKKRKKDLEPAIGKTKQNCAKKSSDGYANTRTVAQTSNSGSSATRSKKAKTLGAANASNSRSSATRSLAKTRGTVKARNSAKASNSGSSGAKMRQVAKIRNSKSSASYSEQPSYRPNGIHSGYPYPQQRHPHYNYNQTPTEVLRRNNIGIPQANRGTHHMPSYNVDYTSSASGVPHGHVIHSYNMSYSSAVHGQLPNTASYGSHPYGYPAFQLDPRRQVVFDDRVSGGQFHGWRRL